MYLEAVLPTTATIPAERLYSVHVFICRWLILQSVRIALIKEYTCVCGPDAPTSRAKEGDKQVRGPPDHNLSNHGKQRSPVFHSDDSNDLAKRTHRRKPKRKARRRGRHRTKRCQVTRVESKRKTLCAVSEQVCWGHNPIDHDVET